MPQWRAALQAAGMAAAARAAPGRAELRAAAARDLWLVPVLFVLSLCTNALLLTGPLYMLQVYDRVLRSHSEETLVALTVITAFLFLAMGMLDHARARILARVGARFQQRLDRRVFAAAVARLAAQPGDPEAHAAQRDLESVQRLLASPVVAAIFDIPWTPLFVGLIFLFHPWLGLLAMAGGGLLIGIAALHRIGSRATLKRAAFAGFAADRFADQLKAEAGAIRSLGMADAGFDRWQRLRSAALATGSRASDLTGGFTTTSRTLRLFLQSAILGMGALLALRGQLSPGAMLASSILFSRALAPVETAIAQWEVVQRAQEAWLRLSTLLTQLPERAPRTALPRPQALLEVEQITVVPPGDSRPALRMVSFRLEPGQAIGVIGSTGSGKSTLARSLTGVWPIAAGRIRLDGTALEGHDPERLGRWIGYLPQHVVLFDGTIAENIARLDTDADPQAVVAAARLAGAHDMIVSLPDGYDTRVSSAGGRLSGGQIQRVGLARALYGDPVLLILDEPNASIDHAGSTLLNDAVRQLKAQGKALLIMAHRPVSIQECDRLMLLENGTRRAFGPREEVLRENQRGHARAAHVPSAPGPRHGDAAGKTPEPARDPAARGVPKTPDGTGSAADGSAAPAAPLPGPQAVAGRTRGPDPAPPPREGGA